MTSPSSPIGVKDKIRDSTPSKTSIQVKSNPNMSLPMLSSSSAVLVKRKEVSNTLIDREFLVMLKMSL